MKQRSLEYKKKLIEKYIQEGFEIITDFEKESIRLKEVELLPDEEIHERVEFAMEEAMLKWLERSGEKLESLITEEEYQDLYRADTFSIDDYLDRFYALLAKLDGKTKELKEGTKKKLLRIDVANAKVINLDNGAEDVLYGTDSWKYLEILIEAKGQRVHYPEICAKFPTMKGDQKKYCGDLKHNFYKRLQKLGLPKTDIKKIITTKRSHSLNLDCVEIR